jgi:putative oxidoreductase
MFTFFKARQDVGMLLMRLFIGGRLLYGVLDNVFNWSHMLKFRDFLHLFHFPMPLVSAVVSVYAQAIAGVFILIGWKIRWASLIMVFNFIVALVAVHWGQSVEQMTPALAMLFGNLLFLFTGAGKYALDREPMPAITRAYT